MNQTAKKKQTDKTKEQQKSALTTVHAVSAVTLFQDDNVEKLVAEIEQEVSSIVPDLSSLKGRNEIASLGYKVARAKTSLDGLGKDLGSEFQVKLTAIQRERKVIRDRLDAQKAAQEAEELKQKEIQEAEERVRKEQAEMERVRKEEERKAEEEREKRAADARHQGKIRKEVLDALKGWAGVNEKIREADLEELIHYIDNGKIKNVTINY